MAKARTLSHGDDQTTIRRVREWFDVARGQVRVEAGAEAANARAITIQVTDRLGRDWDNRAWLLKVYLTTTDGGAPSATGNTVAWTTGTVVSTDLANAIYEVITDSDGLAAFSLTIVGAATRYVMVEVGSGEFLTGGPFAWS